ncbi:MAG: alanine racemase, partial [Microthrixaceae bacterium]
MTTEGAPEIDARQVSLLAEQIASRGVALRERIDALAQRPVRILAVTKGQPVEVAAAALQAGYPELGENYAQELRDKAPRLPDARWHFIGRLQTNKVRLISSAVSVWESLDRGSAIEAVAKRSPGAQAMVQVDLAGLEGRGGCDRRAVPALVDAAHSAGMAV